MTADLTHTVTHFSGAAEWTGVTDGDRIAWLAMRQTMVTASDVACILGESTRSALSVYADKVCPPPEEEEALELDDPRLWGSVLEQPILTTVAAKKGWSYRKGGALLRSRKYPWLGATLDAEIDRHDGNGWINLEGKTSQVTREWDEDEERLPTPYLIQVHSQAVVIDSPLSVVWALLVGCRPCQIDVEKSSRLQSLIVETSHDFMERVKRLDPPDPDHRDSSRKALERLHGPGDGDAVRLPAAAVEWAHELAAIAERKKEDKRREDEIKNLLRASIGSASYGVLEKPVDGKQFFRWQQEARGKVLRQMKSGPRNVRRLPAATTPPTLEDQLRASVADHENVTPIHRGRRRSRR